MSRNEKYTPLSCESAGTTVSTSLGHSRSSVTDEYSKPLTGRIDLAFGHVRESVMNAYFGSLLPIRPTVR